MDVESQSSQSRERATGLQFIRLGKMPLPLRKGHATADIFKFVLCFTIAACIGQLLWIQKLQAGIRRVDNDWYDNNFGPHITRASPEIWDDVHQSFIHDAKPIHIHSHNDEWRRIPLFEALASGCISIEIDVHMVRADLLVGHSAHSLQAENNLYNMYLQPLQRMLEKQNSRPSSDGLSWRGIFNKDPQQSLVLLVDHKSIGIEVFGALNDQLQPLRDLDYLTYWNGTEKITRPLTIVATGNAPFESILALPDDHRDIFWDAPLESLPSRLDDHTVSPPIYKYNQSNSHYASTQFRNAILWRPAQYLKTVPSTQVDDIHATQIEQAAARGLVTRYWDAPSEPPNLQETAWRALLGAKVGLINMDDMGAVRDRARGWSEGNQW